MGKIKQIKGVSNVDKDAIDWIIVTVTEATSDNTFYLDDMYGERRRQIILTK